MKPIRGRVDARSHPSRFHFALFRLIAFALYRAAHPRARPELFLIGDRDQTAWEHYLVALWYVATMSCFTAELLSMHIALAFVIVVAFVHLLLSVIGVALRNRNNIRLQSMLYMTLLLGGAAFYALADSWVRFAAWQALGVAALNAFCAIILFAMREAVPSAA